MKGRAVVGLLVVAAILGGGVWGLGASAWAAGESGESLLGAGERALEGGDYGTAEAACQVLVSNFPSYEAEARSLLAEVYFALGRVTAAEGQAVLALEQMTQQYPAAQVRLAQLQAQVAHVQAASADFAERQATLEQIRTAAPGSPRALEARYQLGALYAGYFQYERAVAEWQGLLEEPAPPGLARKTLKLLTYVCTVAPQPAVVAVLPELLRRHYGGDAELSLVLLRWYAQQGQLELLRAGAEALVAAQPTSEQAAQGLLLLARAYGQHGPLEQAQAVSERLVWQYPQSPATSAALLAVVQAYGQHGQPAQAQAVSERLVGQYPQSPATPRALLVVVQAYRQQGQLGQAQAGIQRLQGLLESAPGNAAAAEIFVVACAEYAPLALPGEQLAKLQELSASSPETGVGRQAGELCTRVGQAHYAEGRRLGQEGQYAQAREELARVRAVSPGLELMAAALYQQGIAYHAEGDEASARAAFTQLQRDYPQHYLSTRAQDWLERLRGQP